MKSFQTPFLIALFALLSGCGPEPVDIHAEPREAKAYESAPVASMDAAQLIEHLKELSSEMTAATQEKRFVELHHLEVALTKALVALEPQTPPQARPSIDTLKIIAAKIHGAGHDQNATMAAKLDQTLANQIATLEKLVN